MAIGDMGPYIEQINRLTQRINELESELARLKSKGSMERSATTLEMRLNPSVARDAVVLSEIIGPAVSKRRRDR